MAKVFLAAAGVLFLAQSTLPPAFPREGMEISFQNERVVIWKGLTGIKGRPTAKHEHKHDLAAVFLDDGGISRAIFPDGTSSTREAPTLRGDLTYSTKGVVHIEEWLTDGILPASFPREGATLKRENDRVALWEYQWQAGRQLPLHAQTRDAVIVLLESGHRRGGVGGAAEGDRDRSEVSTNSGSLGCAGRRDTIIRSCGRSSSPRYCCAHFQPFPWRRSRKLSSIASTRNN
jgi:hypothetical protein